MLKITIKIQDGNQAFEYNRDEEIATILRRLIASMSDWSFAEGEQYSAFDTNGAKSATATIEEK